MGEHMQATELTEPPIAFIGYVFGATIFNRDAPPNGVGLFAVPLIVKHGLPLVGTGVKELVPAIGEETPTVLKRFI